MDIIILMKISYSKAILMYNIKSFRLCLHMLIIIEKVKVWMRKYLVINLVVL